MLIGEGLSGDPKGRDRQDGAVLARSTPACSSELQKEGTFMCWAAVHLGCIDITILAARTSL